MSRVGNVVLLLLFVGSVLTIGLWRSIFIFVSAFIVGFVVYALSKGAGE